MFGRTDQAFPRAALAGFEPHADDMELELVLGGHFLVDLQPQLVAERAKSFLAM